MDIPKIIHQIWIGSKNPPTQYINTWNVDYIKQHPDWKYMFWNEDNLFQLWKHQTSDFPIQDIKRIYQMETEMCGKADILRLVILYLYGGVYIDADMVWINNKSLYPLLVDASNTGFFCSKEPDQYFLVNSVIGSTVKHNNIIFLLNELSKLRNDYKHIRIKKSVYQVTGPLLLNKIKESKLSYTIYPQHYFYPINWHGITDKELHLKIDLPNDSYMFQYGITTNNLVF